MARLNQQEKQEVIRMFACWTSVREIQRRLREDFGQEISHQALYKFQKRHDDKINAARQHFLANLEQIPISNTAKRLQILQQLIDDLTKPEHLWADWSTDADGNIRRKGNHGVIGQLIREARAEMEALKERASGDIYSQLYYFSNITAEQADHFIRTGELLPPGRN